MSRIQYRFVRGALAALGVDDPKKVRTVYMDHEKVVVYRTAEREDGMAFTVGRGHLALAEETMLIDYSAMPSDEEPVPASEPPGVKPDPDRAFRDHNGRIWVLHDGKLHLAGWLHGIEPLELDNMTELCGGSTQLAAAQKPRRLP